MNMRSNNSPLNLLNILVLAFIAILFLALDGDAINLNAEVDKRVVSVGERFTYSISLESASLSAPDIKAPELRDFDIVAGPSSSTSISMIGTQVTRQASLTYTLRAKRTGNFTIPPATVVHNRKTISSPSIEIEVVATSSQSRTQQSQQGQTTQQGRGGTSQQSTQTRQNTPEMFFVAEIEKDTVWRMDMVVVTYKLYFRNDVSSYNFVKFPQTSGFWIEEFSMPSRPVTYNVTINGTRYTVADLRKVAMFPTRSGTLTIDPMSVDVTYNIQTQRQRSRSIWDDPFAFGSRRETVTLNCDPINIYVKQFPIANKPADFKGYAGDYQMRVEYDKMTLPQHEPITLKVTINGTGYLKGVDAPEIKLPSGFEMFAPTSEQNVNLTNDVMRGRKVFTYLVIPRRAGNFEIEPIRFSFFDPKSNQYKTLSEGGGVISVTATEGFSDAGTFIPQGRSGIEILGQDIRFIRNIDEPFLKVQTPIYMRWWYYAAMGVAPIIFLLGILLESVYHSQRKDSFGYRKRLISEAMQKYFREAEKLIKSNSTNQVVAELNKLLLDYLAAMMKTSTAGVTTDEIRNLLSSKNMDVNDIDNVIRLLNDGDMIRFAGGSVSTDFTNNYLETCRNLFAKLEKI